ncbi:MAG: hypothetical protein ACYSYU_11765 [Planctomycetota bacterium]|jgi:hypothetical protein
MSDLILTESQKPFATEPAAKRKLIELEKIGMNVAIVPVEGGFALKDMTIPVKNEGDKGKAPRRPKRVPLGTRSVLTVRPQDKDPNYEYRFINDKDDRIPQAQEAGWEFVASKDKKIPVGDPKAGKDTQVGTPVTKAVGGGVTAYLMRIHKDWYDEDQAANGK